MGFAYIFVLNVLFIAVPFIFPESVTDVFGWFFVFMYTLTIGVIAFTENEKVFEKWDKEEPQWKFSWYFNLYGLITSMMFIGSWYYHGYYWVSIIYLIAWAVIMDLKFKYTKEK